MGALLTIVFAIPRPEMLPVAEPVIGASCLDDLGFGRADLVSAVPMVCRVEAAPQ